MNKTLMCFVIFVLSLLFFLNANVVNAQDFILFDNYHVINHNEKLNIHENNILIDVINNGQILDLNNEYFLYNYNNALYLYDLKSKNNLYIKDDVYNGKLFAGGIVYESDFDDRYICKTQIESVRYRNCYKLYYYDLLTNKEEKLDLLGADNYINDIDETYIVYTSIHNRDDMCDSVCSYVNLYDYKNNYNVTISDFDELSLEMSGNAYIDNNIVFFESVPKIYSCEYSQVFAYDVLVSSIQMITSENNNCFNSNNEIINVKDGYVIYKTRYKNFNTQNYINHLYSYKDLKYKVIDNKCSEKSFVDIKVNEVFCLENEYLVSFAVDNIHPTINIEKKYVALKEEKEKLINQLEYEDDLSSKQNITINILNGLSNVGEQLINVEICDKFKNCTVEKILVEVIDMDITPPKIYCVDTITIKINGELNLDKYGYAIDNVDGKLSLKLVNNVDLSKKGIYKILIKSEDSSENNSYKEIELIIYDSFNINFIYYTFIFLTLISIIIIYIFRFKKRY